MNKSDSIFIAMRFIEINTLALIFIAFELTVLYSQSIDQIDLESELKRYHFTKNVSEWKANPGVVLKTNSDYIAISGTQIEDKNLLTINIKDSVLKDNEKFRLKCDMKVNSISDAGCSPCLKIVIKDRKGIWLRDYRTFSYGTREIGSWQNLFVDFELPNNAYSGYIALEKDTESILDVQIDIRELKLIQLSKSPSQESFNHKCSDVASANNISIITENNDTYPFKKSDVIAYSQGSIDDYQKYGVTFVAWGGYPKPDSVLVAEFEKQIKDALKREIKIGFSFGTRTEYRGFIDFKPSNYIDSICQTVNGDLIIVPDRIGTEYKGLPAYWFCTNSPSFQDYLKHTIKAGMNAEPYSVFMDDPIGTSGTVTDSLGGCYCQNCSAIFKNYLKKKIPKDQLLEYGISDIETFNLKNFHEPYANIRISRRPLYNEIVDCQLEQSTSLFIQMMEYAIHQRGEKILVSGNINPVKRGHDRYLNLVNYFASECAMGAETKNLSAADSLLFFKIADALKRPAAIMGQGRDHAFVQEKSIPGMVRAWIAEAYANGNYFMAPYKLWAYSSKKGSHNYTPKNHNDIAPLYRFIKTNAALFDNYNSSSPVAFIHSFKAFKEDPDTARMLVNLMANLNIPFDIIIAGDHTLNIQIDKNLLSNYDSIILPNNYSIDLKDECLLERYIENGGNIIHDINKLDPSYRIGIEGAESIRASLRIKSLKEQETFYIVHLLNRDYSIKSDSCKQKTEFVVKIPSRLLKKKINKIEYFQPPSWNVENTTLPPEEVAPQDLKFKTQEGYTQIIVPHIDMWGILLLSCID